MRTRPDLPDVSSLTSLTLLCRETSSFFIASYFFPGCEAADSILPSKMVKTCRVTLLQLIGAGAGRLQHVLRDREHGGAGVLDHPLLL